MYNLPMPEFMQRVKELEESPSCMMVEISLQRNGDFTPITSTFVLENSKVDELDKVFKTLCSDLFGHHFNLSIKIRS